MKTLQRPAYTPSERAERTREFVRYFTIVALLLAFCGLLSGCAARLDGPTHEQQAERAAPDMHPAGLHPAEVKTYTDAHQFEVPEGH